MDLHAVCCEFQQSSVHLHLCSWLVWPINCPPIAERHIILGTNSSIQRAKGVRSWAWGGLRVLRSETQTDLSVKEVEKIWWKQSCCWSVEDKQIGREQCEITLNEQKPSTLEKMEERLLNEHNHDTSTSKSRTGIKKSKARERDVVGGQQRDDVHSSLKCRGHAGCSCTYQITTSSSDKHNPPLHV